MAPFGRYRVANATLADLMYAVFIAVGITYSSSICCVVYNQHRMSKLPRKRRFEMAMGEAEFHVRKFGMVDFEDWAYSYAVHWGFEEDEKVIESIAAHMKAVSHQEIEKKKQDWKARRERLIPKPAPDDWPK